MVIGANTPYRVYATVLLLVVSSIAATTRLVPTLVLVASLKQRKKGMVSVDSVDVWMRELAPEQKSTT